MPEAPGPLHEIVVVDFATRRAELAGRVLAELGAAVVKVEPPGGAESRRMPPFAGSTDQSLYWEVVAAGKRSVVVDLCDSAGLAELQPLLERADILIESFDPGVMEGLGLGYEQLAAANPGIVYVSVTPYGQSGPDAGSPATDLTIEAAAGLLGLQGDRDRPPVPIGYPQASFHAGVQAAADALVALNARADSGLGQRLDVSMQAAMVWTLMSATGYPKVTGDDPPGTGANRKSPVSAIPGVEMPAIWECADGFVTCTLAGGRVGSTPLQTILNQAAAEGGLDDGLAKLDWTAWPVDLAAGKLTPADVGRALEAVTVFFRGHTRNELMEFGTRTSLLIAAVFDVPALLNEPQLKARDYWRTVAGRVQPGPPVRLSATPMRDPQPAPRLGADQHLLEKLPPARTGLARAGATRRPFEGLKVADFAWIGVGPIVSKALADHGATVVHVESPSRPDLLRTVPPFNDNIPGLDRAQFMANFNTSKLGLNLNLSTEAGREVARDLIRWSDVVLESFTAGTFARLGFSHKTLAAEQPDLVMFSTCLRGQTGPQCMYGGYGGQGAALAGIYSVTGWPDRPPSSPWGAYTDFIAPRYGVAALSAALLHRKRTGQGQHIDLAQVEAGIHFIEPLVLDYTVNGRVPGPAGHESPTASPHGVYQARGVERYVAIACETTAEWHALQSVAPLAEFSGPAFDGLAARLAADSQIDAAIAAWCANEDPFQVVERLKRARVPAAVVQRPSDLYEDPQLAHRGFFVTCEHAVMGPTPYDGPATIFSRTPAKLSAAPCLGQHTHEVLRDILGYCDHEIAEYAARGAMT